MAEVAAVASEIADVKKEIKTLEGCTDDISKQRELTLQQRLTALQQEKVLLMQQQATSSAAAYDDDSAGDFSPRSRFMDWTIKHQSMPAGGQRLKQLQAARVLPKPVLQLLQRCLFPVPADGLFAVQQRLGVGNTLAFSRDDLLQLLISQSQQQKPYHVQLLHGLRRTGKSFSMPWALVEAIRLIKQGKSGCNEGSGGNSCNSNSSSSNRIISFGGGSSSSGGGVKRVPFILIVSCHNEEQLNLEQQQLLLAAAAFLGVPAIFDEFSSWPQLPSALVGYLETTTFGHLQLLTPQFVLMDSLQSTMTAAAGPSGPLAGRTNVGVADRQRMPLPSLQLIAGMLQQYHPHLYPHKFLEVLACTGFRLDRLTSQQPCRPLQALSLRALQDAVLIEDSLLDSLRLAVVNGHGSTDNSNTVQLWDMGLLACCHLEPKLLVLAAPQLIMMNILQSAFDSFEQVTSTEMLQQLAATAEGRVLEALVRTYLLPAILERIDLAGRQHRVVWGNLGRKCELDFAMLFTEGPLVWGSCKRKQSEQTWEAFETHIRSLAHLASGIHHGLQQKKKLQKAQDAKRAEQQYEQEPAIMMMRSMLSGKGLQLVAVSAIAAGPQHQLPRMVGKVKHIAVKFDGEEHNVQCFWHDMLFTELVQPMAVESLQLVQPLGASLWGSVLTQMGGYCYRQA